MRVSRSFIRIMLALVALGSVVALFATHESSTHARSESRVSRQAQSNGEAPDWDHPFVDGVSVPAITNAAGRVSFRPVAPPAAGQPLSIFVHGAISDQAEQALALVYRSPVYGRFLVLEVPTGLTEQGLEAIPSQCRPETGCEGTWKVVTLVDGTRALLIAGPVSNGVLWLRRSVLFDVFGPTDTFSVSSATALASLFAKAS